MFFIGQKHIMRQLQFLLPHLYETGAGMNFLIRGPSGWGKTRMALMMCNYLAGRDFEYCIGDKPKFSSSKRVHFIDEVHLIDDPEFLYPKMDGNQYVIIIATNDVSTLKEALVNRCVEFVFSNYTIEELRVIAKSYITVNVSDPIVDYIIESGGGNPRIIKSMALRLNIFYSTYPEVASIGIDEFKRVMSDVFGVNDGMDTMCYRYVQALEKLGGTASLQTLSSVLHIDQSTLRAYVEPVLLYKNKIKITSKGRSIY